MCGLDRNGKLRVGSEYTLGQPRERHGRVVELAQLFCGELAFLLPERVEQTDKCRPLAEVIMQIEKLKTIHSWRSQIRLDLLFVTGELKLTRGVGEVFVSREHSL